METKTAVIVLRTCSMHMYWCLRWKTYLTPFKIQLEFQNSNIKNLSNFDPTNQPTNQSFLWFPGISLWREKFIIILNHQWAGCMKTDYWEYVWHYLQDSMDNKSAGVLKNKFLFWIILVQGVDRIDRLWVWYLRSALD